MPPDTRPTAALRRFWLFVALAIAAAAPALVLRLIGHHFAPIPPVLQVVVFGAALLGAGFLLSWGAEAAEEHVSQGLAMAVLALVTVLPEYAVDIYYALQAGRHPGSEYAPLAAANMTGANRLLIGTAWPLIVLLFWWRTGGKERAVLLREDNAAEIAYLALASLYGFVIAGKGRIDLFDAAVLGGIFAAYLWRVSRLPRKGSSGVAESDEEDEDDEGEDDEIEVGPAAALIVLPKRQQWAIMGSLIVIAAFLILLVAAPFAESLVGAGAALGVDKFLLVQWVAPLAGEAPEIIICILFSLALRPSAALGALVSDKINQWTLLVGMLPVFVSLGAARVTHLPLNARQHEEFFLTAAQSVFAVSLLLRLRLTLAGALTLLALFTAQISLAFVYQHDEIRAISHLTGMGWLYLALAAGLIALNGKGLVRLVRVGLLGAATEPPQPSSSVQE